MDTNACACELSGFCAARNMPVSASLQTICQKNPAKVDRLLGLAPPFVAESPQLSQRSRQHATTTHHASREAVGTAIKARINGLLAIKATYATCGCQTLATEMDKWGIAGCELRREEIVGKLVGNRDMLIAALRTRAAEISVVLPMMLSVMDAIVPDAALRFGANWLLTQAIEDVQKSTAKSASSRSSRSSPSSVNSVVSPPDRTRFSGQCVMVTSINPNPARRGRQITCLKSWQEMGLSIISVNTSSERDLLEEFHDFVQFRICEDMSSGYDRQTQFISSLIDAGKDADLPFFLINSDIEIHGDHRMLSEALAMPDCLTIGIRYNHKAGSRSSAVRESSGLDVFGMTPELASTIPRMKFGIGKPVWDYWLPHHFLNTNKFHWIDKPLFYHETHDLGWSRSEWKIGVEWMRETYGIKDVNGMRGSFNQQEPVIVSARPLNSSSKFA